ncbi:uncharacterized protein LY89DRAFT_687127 [Mollisia scopiformis]|uniref:Uncharacterized protein n=1 Tax=Mollisia scopiformis TaxID=149040 RepID=A0A194X0M8_MOLSC|nr:uncharacterized protein LY89DRAFT_687127 [Mollisia scopiformis]KUJ13751.1 hypothetical protein LY89DRAFT_687127 [Mollisia scopiformis]
MSTFNFVRYKFQKIRSQPSNGIRSTASIERYQPLMVPKIDRSFWLTTARHNPPKILHVGISRSKLAIQLHSTLDEGFGPPHPIVQFFPLDKNAMPTFFPASSFDPFRQADFPQLASNITTHPASYCYLDIDALLAQKNSPNPFIISTLS